nr:hypothetical protein [Tanacetum cinerariifolium]
MMNSVEKRNHTKFCVFHGEVGNNTDECMNLKKQIEEMLKAGKLSHLIKELKHNSGNEQPKETKKRETFGTDKALAILMEAIAYTTCTWMADHIQKYCMNTVSTNQLVPATTPLIGFSGDRKFRAVLSIAHGMLKLPVEGGVIALKSSRLVPLECMLVFGLEETFSDTKPILEERVKVEINIEYPKQAVMIGSTLTEGGHNKLCGLLHRNLDIFAWKPADMIGVPRHITEH